MNGKLAAARAAAVLLTTLLLNDLLSLLLFSGNDNGQQTSNCSGCCGGSSFGNASDAVTTTTIAFTPTAYTTGADNSIANDRAPYHEHEPAYQSQLIERGNRILQDGSRFFVLFADAKGVAGLGKAGGDGTGGSDKAGQQVPPEVYNALTYAGTAFLFTLSVPLILYGLNKLLNKIEDCFGCGPSSKKAHQLEIQQRHQQQLQQQQLRNQQLQQELEPSKLQSQLSSAIINGPLLNNQLQQPTKQDSGTSITIPFDPELNYDKTISTAATMANNGAMQQQNFQQHPYIISGPHI